MTRWLVLDLDDTLILERDYVRSGFNAVNSYVSSAWNINGFGEKCWEHFELGVRGNTFNIVADGLSLELTEVQFDELVRTYREHKPTMELSSQTKDALNLLRETFSLVLLTGGNVDVQQNKVNALGLTEYFEHIVFAGAWGPKLDKPNKKGWVEVQNILKLKGNDLTYVGDNPYKDWPACRELGWNFIRVRQPESLHFDITTPLEVTEISHISELQKLL